MGHRDQKAGVFQIIGFLLLVIFALIGGCTTVDPLPIISPEPGKVEKILFPALGDISTAQLGDRLVAEGYRKTEKVLTISNPVSFIGDGNCKTTLNGRQTKPMVRMMPSNLSEETPASLGQLDQCFGGFTGTFANTRQTELIVCFDGSNFYQTCAVTGFKNWHKVPLTSGSLEIPKERTSETQPSFVQELTYNGRVQDQLKFVYREFTDSMIRPGFTQEAQYDISTDNVIGFKRLRIEILEATNLDIKYRVLKHFN